MDALTKRRIEESLKNLSKAQQEKVKARKMVEKRVDAFIRVQKYISLVKSGVEPLDAALQVGINIPVSRDTNPMELLHELEEKV